MSAVAPDRSAASADARGRRPSRRPEILVVAVGLVLAVLTMGGFTLVINQIDQQTFAEVVMPSLMGEGSTSSVAEAHEAARTLAAWFGVSLVVTLLLSAAGIALARSRPRRRTAAGWFLAAGAVCLLGSQLVLFPIAFPFFLAAGLMALRQLPEGGPR